MLDSCSTYVTERAAHELDLDGPAQNLIISGTDGVEMKIRSRQVTSVSTLDNCFKGSLSEAITLSLIRLFAKPKASIPTSSEPVDHTHFARTY